jgi:hypothetical protein
VRRRDLVRHRHQRPRGAWGNGTAGQLGNGDRRSSTAPVKVEVKLRATMISSTANDAVVDS